MRLTDSCNKNILIQSKIKIGDYLKNSHEYLQLVAAYLQSRFVISKHSLGPVVVNFLLLPVVREDVRLTLVGGDTVPGRRRHRVLGLEVNINLLSFEEEIVQDVGMIPDLAANSKRLERIGDTPGQYKNSQ